MAKGGQTSPGDAFASAAAASAPFSPAPPEAAPAESAICRFLVSEADDGMIGPAIPAVDPANRCIALTVPKPQFPQQQHLVCLTAGHVDCPRYLRGVLVEGSAPATSPREPISRPVVGAALVLLAAVAASFGFLAVRGGFDLAVSTSPAPAIALLPSSSVAGAASVAPTAEPTASVEPSPSLEPSPSVAISPSPTVAPTPRPTPRPTPAPTSDRFALLTRCPSTPNCWIYVIRAGDNLRSIANYFGVDYNRMLAMNPNLRIPIHPGDHLRIPTPTR
jgi:hypothetical protein